MPERGSSIASYLAELNQELEVRLGRRRRILTEIEDHLLTATAVAIGDGASLGQAERTATTALGTPQEVAKTFGGDVLSILDRRLRSVADAADRLERSHRVGRLARDWPPFASAIASLAIVASAGLLPWSTLWVSLALLVIFAPLSFIGALGQESPTERDIWRTKRHIPWAAAHPWWLTMVFVSTASSFQWSIWFTALGFFLVGSIAVDKIGAHVSTWVGLSVACVLTNPYLLIRIAGPVEPFNAPAITMLSVLYGLSLLVGGAWSKARAEREDLDAQLGAALRGSGPAGGTAIGQG